MYEEALVLLQQLQETTVLLLRGQISLPVQVFEPRSFLERITDNWGYLDLLEAAADCTDPVDRLRYLVGFVIGGLRRQTSTLKPFNPILGETYQACFLAA